MVVKNLHEFTVTADLTAHNTWKVKQTDDNTLPDIVFWKDTSYWRLWAASRTITTFQEQQQKVNKLENTTQKCWTYSGMPTFKLANVHSILTSEEIGKIWEIWFVYRNIAARSAFLVQNVTSLCVHVPLYTGTSTNKFNLCVFVFVVSF